MAITQEKQKRREIKVTGVLTRKIANLHQKRCLQQADSNTRPPRNYVTKNLGPATSARVTLRQKRRKEGTEKREEKRTRSRRTKPNRSDTDQIQDPQVIKIKAE